MHTGTDPGRADGLSLIWPRACCRRQFIRKVE